MKIPTPVEHRVLALLDEERSGVDVLCLYESSTKEELSRHTLPYPQIAIPWSEYAVLAEARQAAIAEKERTQKQNKGTATLLVQILKSHGIEGVEFPYPYGEAVVSIAAMSAICHKLEDPPRST